MAANVKIDKTCNVTSALQCLSNFTVFYFILVLHFKLLHIHDSYSYIEKH